MGLFSCFLFLCKFFLIGRPACSFPTSPYRKRAFLLKPFSMNAKIFFPLSIAAAGITYYFSKIQIKNIVSRLPRSAPWPERDLSEIDDITIHHAASSKTATAYDFARWHISEKGWPGIGYHFVIDRSGQIFQTNPLNAYSYHNGKDNKGAIGVCLVGNFQDYPPTPNQQKSLIRLIRKLKGRLNIKTLTGHREYPGASTSCPGRFLDPSFYRSRTNLPIYGSTKKQSVKSLVNFNKNIVYDPATADN